jgi:uncharacterized membrane protein YbhN (UPF0104 family)
MPEFSLALLAVVPLAAVELAKAMRWRVLFGKHRPTYAVCLRALVAGQITNFFAPLRAGDAVRLGVLTAQGGELIPGAGALAGAKAIDSLCLGAIALAVAGTSAISRPQVGLIAGIVVILAGAGLALFGRGLRGRLEANPIARKLRLAALIDVAQAFRDPQVLLTVVVMTCVVWGAGMLANGIILAAVGLPADVSLAARVIVAGYLIGILPSPPAQIGTFEAAVTVALTSAGVPVQQALAASISLHVGQLVKLGLLLALSMALLWNRRAPLVEPARTGTPTGI